MGPDPVPVAALNKSITSKAQRFKNKSAPQPPYPSPPTALLHRLPDTFTPPVKNHPASKVSLASKPVYAIISHISPAQQISRRHPAVTTTTNKQTKCN